MRIAAVQTRPVAGDLPANTEAHLRLVELAADAGAGLVFFPELSLTGYEPTLAGNLAMHPDDPRLDVFAAVSANRGVTIGLGAPTRGPAGVHISTILFRPDGTRGVVSKHHLHADETPFFAAGPAGPNLIDRPGRIALAICYEVSVPAHAREARESGAAVYLASVAKTADAIEPARQRLQAIARDHAMTVVMANCVGVCDGARCAGRSAAWDEAGALRGELDGAVEGVLVIDTETRDVLICPGDELGVPASPSSDRDRAGTSSARRTQDQQARSPRMVLAGWSCPGEGKAGRVRPAGPEGTAACRRRCAASGRSRADSWRWRPGETSDNMAYGR